MTILTREGLYEEIWSSPMTSVSKKYGISDVGLRKIAVSLGIPVPPRGYWARIQNGQKLPRQPLRSWKGDTTYQLSEHRAVIAAAGGNTNDPPGVAEAKEFERAPENHISVPDVLEKPHPVAGATKKALTEHKPYRSLPVWKAGGQGLFTIEVSKSIVERALILADVFVKAAVRRGYELSWSSENKSANRDVLFLTLTRDGSHYRVRLRQKPGTLVLEHGEYSTLRRKDAPPPVIQTPILQLDLSDYMFGYGVRTFQDTPSKPLEMQLNNAFLWMATHPIRKAIEKAAQDELARQRHLAYEDRMRPFRIRDAEVERLKHYEKEALEFARAESLRAYADAMENKIRESAPVSKPDDPIYEPVVWIRARANWIDPLHKERWPAVDDLVDVREPSYWEH